MRIKQQHAAEYDAARRHVCIYKQTNDRDEELLKLIIQGFDQNPHLHQPISSAGHKPLPIYREVLAFSYHASETGWYRFYLEISFFYGDLRGHPL